MRGWWKGNSSPACWTALAVALAAVTCTTGCGGGQAGRPDVVTGETPHATPASDPVQRGQYLVSVGACGDCHTPMRMGPNGPEPDTSSLLAGHPASLVLGDPPKLQQPWLWAGTATNTA